MAGRDASQTAGDITASVAERAGLEVALGGLVEAAGLLRAGEVADRLRVAAERLAELVLEVAIVGEFKRGKSSLLNALLGEEVLPTGVLPLTAVPTVVTAGSPACEVVFGDGRVEVYPLGALDGFVTEDANPGNRLGVHRVTVRLPAPVLRGGVRLVDTPGVGSVLAHNTRATGAYLPSLDAAVLVLAADPPISAGERAFLARVAEHAVRLFVVLNKADHLSGEELARTVAFTERVVRQTVPGWQGPVHALSARPGVGDPAGLARFVGDFTRFVRHEHASAVADAAGRVAARAMGTLRLALEVERQAARLPAGELADRRARFEQTVEALAEEAAADQALLGGAVTRGLAALDEIAARHRARLEAEAVAATDALAAQHATLGARELLEVLDRERAGLLDRLAGPVVAEAQQAAVEAFHAAVGPVIGRAEQRLARLHAETADTFELELPTLTPPELAVQVGPVGFAQPRMELLAEQLAMAGWRLLGPAAARARALARARQMAAEQARALLGRARGAASLALGEAARQLNARLRRHEQQLATTLRAAVERGGGLLQRAAADQAVRLGELDRAAGLLDQAQEATSAAGLASDGGG